MDVSSSRCATEAKDGFIPPRGIFRLEHVSRWTSPPTLKMSDQKWPSIRRFARTYSTGSFENRIKVITHQKMVAFPITVMLKSMGGVSTVLSTRGMTAKNKNRMLINLHSGGFPGGSTFRAESIADRCAPVSFLLMNTDMRSVFDYHGQCKSCQ